MAAWLVIKQFEVCALTRRMTQEPSVAWAQPSGVAEIFVTISNRDTVAVLTETVSLIDPAYEKIARWKPAM